MPFYGAEPVDLPDLGGGLVLDVDATEIGPDQASDCQNVDLEPDANCTKRLGRKPVNSSAPVGSRVWGAARYYPKSGGPVFVMQAGSKLYADLNGDGDFGDAGEEIATGLSAGRWMDLIQYRDTLYAGNGVDGLRKWTGSGTASLVANLNAPGVPPAVALHRTIVEHFDSNGGWSAAANQTFNNQSVGGRNFLRWALATGAEGGSSSKTPSGASAGVINLAAATHLCFRAKCKVKEVAWQIGISDNGGAEPDWDRWPMLTWEEADKWERFEVPLEAVPPASRTAVPKVWLRFDEAPAGTSFPVEIRIDDAELRGPFPNDTYRYYATYWDSTQRRESEPSAVGVITLNGGIIAPGFNAALVCTEQSGVDKVRLYRIRDNGTFAKPRLVAEVAQAGADTLLDGAIAAGATSLTVDDATGYTTNDYLLINEEVLQVTGIAGTTFTVSRGQIGTAAVTHADNASVSRVVVYTDVRSDLELLAEAAPELVYDRQDPPLAFAYGLANHRLHAGNVTVGAVHYPWRAYLSRFTRPEEFGPNERPEGDPLAAGWFDLPERDQIRRIIDFDGMAIYFCDRSIWSVEGSHWFGSDPISIRKRASVGLDAREAVAVSGRQIYFLSQDGLRVLAPNRGFPGLFETWVVSEPVNSRIRAIPAAYRQDSALGVDERGRVHLSLTRAGQTVADAALVFDPRVPGALQPGENPKRPGWTYYTNWGFGSFTTLRRGGGDAGQMVGADPLSGQLHWLQLDETGTALQSDAGSAIAWHWQSAAVDAGSGQKLEWVYVRGELDPASGQSVTFTPVPDRVASGTTYTVSLGAATAGIVPREQRTAPGVRGRYAQLKVGGAHSVAMKVRSCGFGYWRRG